MKGLILKDLLNLKKQGKIFPLIIVFYMILSVIVDEATFFLGFVVLLCSMVPVTTLAYDEKSKWDKYALTMPVSRKDLVMSKYMLGLLCMLAGVFVTFLFHAVTALVKSQPLDSYLLLTLAVLSSMGLLFLSLNLPLIYKFGTEKGRFIYIAVAILLLMPMTGTSFESYQTMLSGRIEYLYFLPLVAFVLFFASLGLSIKIMDRKNFA